MPSPTKHKGTTISGHVYVCRLLGTVRFSHLDMGTGYKLDTTTGELTPRGSTGKPPKPPKAPKIGGIGRRMSRGSRSKSNDGEVTVLASSLTPKDKGI